MYILYNKEIILGLKIKNIKLDKEKYIYWLDKTINFSFDLESNKNETIKEIVIFYWYNFYWNKQKHYAFQDKIVEKNKVISEWILENFSFLIPITFFNLKVNDWINNIKIENYIDIRINVGLFSKIKEKITPNIIIDKNKYNFSNFYVSNSFDTVILDIQDIEKLIFKKDEEKYLNIVNNIEKYNLELLNITKLHLEDIIEGENLENKELFNKIKELSEKKDSLLILNDNKTEEFNKLLSEKNLLVEKIKKIDWVDDTDFFRDLNELDRKIYKCYKSENQDLYFQTIDYFYNRLKNNNIYNLGLLDDRIDLWEKVKNNEWDFIIVKKKFKWILTWGLTKILEESSVLGDFIHKDIYNELKKNIIINIFDKLVNSKIYNFIYKYIFIFTISVIVLVFIDDLLKNYISLDILWYYYSFAIFFPIFFILFSKWYEQLFNYLLKKSIYTFKLNSNKEIKNNIEYKLINWILKIEDIIKKLEIKTNIINLGYNLKVSLELNVWTYHQEWKHTNYYNNNVYSIDFFNHTWKWYFDLNKVKLLNNDYRALTNILPNSNKNAGTKIYYTLHYKFDSLYLPDIEWNEILYLKFNK